MTIYFFSHSFSIFIHSFDRSFVRSFDWSSVDLFPRKSCRSPVITLLRNPTVAIVILLAKCHSNGGLLNRLNIQSILLSSSLARCSSIVCVFVWMRVHVCHCRRRRRGRRQCYLRLITKICSMNKWQHTHFFLSLTLSLPPTFPLYLPLSPTTNWISSCCLHLYNVMTIRECDNNNKSNNKKNSKTIYLLRLEAKMHKNRSINGISLHQIVHSRR